MCVHAHSPHAHDCVQMEIRGEQLVKSVLTIYVKRLYSGHQAWLTEASHGLDGSFLCSPQLPETQGIPSPVSSYDTPSDSGLLRLGIEDISQEQ